MIDPTEYGPMREPARCGTCFYWKVLNEWEDKNQGGYAVGNCKYPMPASLIHVKQQMQRRMGANCPVHQYQDERETSP